MRRLAWQAGLLAIALVSVAACGVDKPTPKPEPADDRPTVSADDLGDAFEDASAANLLGPDERAALERAGAEPEDTGPVKTDGRHANDPPRGFFRRIADQSGQIGVALLGIGVTLGMIAAPYLLF